MKYFIAIALVILAAAVKAYCTTDVSNARFSTPVPTLELPSLIQRNAIAQFQPCVWPNLCVRAM